jgi:hypothetical protein
MVNASTCAGDPFNQCARIDSINTIHTLESNPHPIPVISCHTYLSTHFHSSSFLLFSLPMTSRTRKSQRLLRLGNHASGLDEGHSSLDHSMAVHTNTTNGVSVVTQDTNVRRISGTVTVPQTNLIGTCNAPESPLIHNKKGAGNIPSSTTIPGSPPENNPLLKRGGMLVRTMPYQLTYLIDIQRSSLSSYAASVDEREQDG